MTELIFKSKYNKGDKFFVVQEDRRLCPYCLCYHEHFFVFEAEIEKVRVGYCGIEYWSKLTLSKNARMYTTLYESSFYETRESAQRECDYKNALLRSEKIRYLK